jgi:hypothetical protein
MEILFCNIRPSRLNGEEYDRRYNRILVMFVRNSELIFNNFALLFACSGTVHAIVFDVKEETAWII